MKKTPVLYWNFLIKPIAFALIATFLIIAVPTLCSSATMKEAFVEAAEYFRNSADFITKKNIVISDIVNYHNQKKDQYGLQLETEFYFVLDQLFPNVKLVDTASSLAGVSSKGTVFINGSYERQGETVVLRLKAVKEMLEGELLAQTEVMFESDLSRKKNTRRCS